MSVSITRAALLTRLTATVLALGWSAITAHSFYDRYWRVRDCFNELGRCWDVENQQVLLEQAGIIWAMACTMGLVLAAFLIRGLVRSNVLSRS